MSEISTRKILSKYQLLLSLFQLGEIWIAGLTWQCVIYIFPKWQLIKIITTLMKIGGK